jgi:hypothetical protein
MLLEVEYILHTQCHTPFIASSIYGQEAKIRDIRDHILFSDFDHAKKIIDSVYATVSFKRPYTTIYDMVDLSLYSITSLISEHRLYTIGAT